LIRTGGSEANWRLFFAAAPSDRVREQIGGAAAALAVMPGAELVARSNYHMTLAFIGEVSTAQVDVIRQIGARQYFTPFRIRFDAYDYWPKPQVVVAAARTVPAALEHLWHHLHADLETHGWALDRKRLRPHVTLSRKVEQPPMLPTFASFEWQVTEFSLMRSVRTSAMPAYTVVDAWPLLDTRDNT